MNPLIFIIHLIRRPILPGRGCHSPSCLSCLLKRWWRARADETDKTTVQTTPTTEVFYNNWIVWLFWWRPRSGNIRLRIERIIMMAAAFLCWSAAALFNLYPARKAGISIRLIRRPLMRECGCPQNNQINQLFNKISCSGCLKQRAFQSVQSAGPYCPSADALRIVRTFSCF